MVEIATSITSMNHLPIIERIDALISSLNVNHLRGLILHLDEGDCLRACRDKLNAAFTKLNGYAPGWENPRDRVDAKKLLEEARAEFLKEMEGAAKAAKRKPRKQSPVMRAGGSEQYAAQVMRDYWKEQNERAAAEKSRKEKLRMQRESDLRRFGHSSMPAEMAA